jgi:exonuclease VII small subunit
MQSINTPIASANGNGDCAGKHETTPGLLEKSDFQQALKERDMLLAQLQRQNLSLKAAVRELEQERRRGCELLRLCVGLFQMDSTAIPSEITEYLGK